MSSNRPEQWSYFEDMNIIGFMNLMLYYKDKQKHAEAIAAKAR